jgi:hypothetical protein
METEGTTPPEGVEPEAPGERTESAGEQTPPPDVEVAPEPQTPAPPPHAEGPTGSLTGTPASSRGGSAHQERGREYTDEERRDLKLKHLVSTGQATADEIEGATPEERQALTAERFDKKYWQKYSEPTHIEPKKPGQLKEDQAFDFAREFLEKDVAPLISGEITIEFARATDFEDQRECTDRKLIMKRNGVPLVALRLQATTNQGPEVKEKMERAERTRLRDPRERIAPVELPSVTKIDAAAESVDPTPRKEIALRILEEARLGMEKHREIYGEGLREYDKLLITARETAERNQPEAKPKKYARRAPRKLKSPPRVIWTRGQGG